MKSGKAVGNVRFEFLVLDTTFVGALEGAVTYGIGFLLGKGGM